MPKSRQWPVKINLGHWRQEILEQYPISDLLAWIEDETLILNPDFQRRSVWPPAAKTYLIDTILRHRPMPNIMVRTVTDLETRRSRREVVDGQQRLNTIRDFANGKLTLGRHAGEYAGKTYEELSDHEQTDFLQYRIGAEQLFNADDEVVLDTFRRLNSYSYVLNAQELRHAGYSGEFRSAVVSASRRWSILWEKYRGVSLRRQLRMDDDQLMAEMIIQGVTDGCSVNLFLRTDTLMNSYGGCCESREVCGPTDRWRGSLCRPNEFRARGCQGADLTEG